MFRITCLCALLACIAAAACAEPLRSDLSEEDRARVAAVVAPASEFEAAEPFERRQGGAGTSMNRFDRDAFSQPSAHLDDDGRQRFLVGNGLFRKDWVAAPASTQASDGLGPLFNARACQSCHFKDGRGHAPAGPGDDALSMVVRLSVPADRGQAAAIAAGILPAAPDPIYGLQLQDHAVAGLSAEGQPSIVHEEQPVILAGGEVVMLRRPALSIATPGYGPLAANVMLSARIAPPMIGLGLLEAIHPDDIVAGADPNDADGDGISGRVHRRAGGSIGRFGWKALEPDVASQAAHAFSSDMGLSTPVAPAPWGDCSETQAACRQSVHGDKAGEAEAPAAMLDLVSFYARHLAVPARRGEADPEVLAGKRVFHETGCISCHRPKFVTRRDAADPAHRFQLIWPHSDLLLHDMGEDLADHRPEGLADGREWRTPPLWGIGLSRTVHGEAGFLHDGRAQTLLEAVLWHGGEAAVARDRFAARAKPERDALIRFLESL